MERVVRVYDPQRQMPVAIRLADIPSLFSEGAEPDDADQHSPSLEALRSRVSQILRQMQVSRPLTVAAPAGGSR
jgi:hypothetical protein